MEERGTLSCTLEECRSAKTIVSKILPIVRKTMEAINKDMGCIRSTTLKIFLEHLITTFWWITYARCTTSANMVPCAKLGTPTTPLFLQIHIVWESMYVLGYTPHSMSTQCEPNCTTRWCPNLKREKPRPRWRKTVGVCGLPQRTSLQDPSTSRRQSTRWHQYRGLIVCLSWQQAFQYDLQTSCRTNATIGEIRP